MRGWSVCLVVAVGACGHHEAASGAADASPVIAPEPGPSADPLASARAKRVESIRAWTPAQRIAWVRHCLAVPCKENEISDIVAAAGSDDEIATLKHLGAARIAVDAAKSAEDGTDLSPAVASVSDDYRFDPDLAASQAPHTSSRSAASLRRSPETCFRSSVTGTRSGRP